MYTNRQQTDTAEKRRKIVLSHLRGWALRSGHGFLSRNQYAANPATATTATIPTIRIIDMPPPPSSPPAGMSSQIAYSVSADAGIVTVAPTAYPVPDPSAIVFHCLNCLPSGAVRPDEDAAVNVVPATPPVPSGRGLRFMRCERDTSERGEYHRYRDEYRNEFYCFFLPFFLFRARSSDGSAPGL